MTHSKQSVVHNNLLKAMSQRDFDRVMPLLRPVILNCKDTLARPDEPVDTVYFVEGGLCSVVATTSGLEQVEVAEVGREGFIGLPVLLGTDASPNLTFVQIAGSAYCMPAEDLRLLLDKCASFREILLRYVHFILIQTQQTALANARFTLEKRLARWILMAHDRTDTNDVPLTHQFLALMLGVRRSGVTTATHILEGEKMIKANRGNVVVLDRAKLSSFAGDSYGVPEKEYERVIGLPIRAH